MGRPVRSKINTQIYEEACEWFVDCRAGDLDNAARAEFDRWLRKSPEHQSAYLEIAAIWNEGPPLDPANRWDSDKLIAEAAQEPANIIALERTRSTETNERTTTAILPPPAQASACSSSVQGSPRGTVRASHATPPPRKGGGSGPRRVPLSAAYTGHRRLFALAASVLLVTAGLATYILASSGVYATALGEQRSLALSDGST